MKSVAFFSLVFAFLIQSSCTKNSTDEYNPAPVVKSNVFKASGDVGTVTAKIDKFRAVLGGPVNTAPGNVNGRREINWDGVPATLTNNNNFPADFFNLKDPGGANGRKRGLEYINNGSALRLDSSNFAEIDPSYADEFIPFSNKKSIISVNSIHTELRFKVAGTNNDASIKGFGVVFIDVDDVNSTSVEFFNDTKSLGVFKAPVGNATGGFSFLGVHFPDEKITSLKITAGNAALAPGVKDLSDGGKKDLVSFDDLFYDEPKMSQ